MSCFLSSFCKTNRHEQQEKLGSQISEMLIFSIVYIYWCCFGKWSHAIIAPASQTSNKSRTRDSQTVGKGSEKEKVGTSRSYCVTHRTQGKKRSSRICDPHGTNLSVTRFSSLNIDSRALTHTYTRRVRKESKVSASRESFSSGVLNAPATRLGGNRLRSQDRRVRENGSDCEGKDRCCVCESGCVIRLNWERRSRKVFWWKRERRSPVWVKRESRSRFKKTSYVLPAWQEIIPSLSLCSFFHLSILETFSTSDRFQTESCSLASRITLLSFSFPGSKHGTQWQKDWGDFRMSAPAS